MHAIEVYPDGLMAVLAAGVMANVLLAGLTVFSLRCLAGARRKRERFSRQRQFPQLVGMSVSLSCYVVIICLSLSEPGAPRPHALNVWLDDSVLLWTLTVLALWPVSSRAFRALPERRQGSARGGHREPSRDKRSIKEGVVQ